MLGFQPEFIAIGGEAYGQRQKDTFNWTLDLTAPSQAQTKRMKPSEIALLQYREKQTGRDSHLDSRITNPQTLLHFCITEADAEEYCHAIGMKFFRKKWKDKTVIISI